MTSTMMDLAVLHQHYVVLLPQLIPSCIMRGSVGLTTVPQQQQPQSQMPSQVYINYAMGPSQVNFLLQVSVPRIYNVIYWCLLVCLLSAFRFPCVCHVYPSGLNNFNPPEYTHGKYMCLLVMMNGPCHECTKWLHISLLQVEGNFLLLTQLSNQTFHEYGEACSIGGLVESHPITLPSLHGGEGSSVLDCVPANDTVDSKSVGGIEPSHSGVVIGYQIDKFPHILLAEYLH